MEYSPFNLINNIIKYITQFCLQFTLLFVPIFFTETLTREIKLETTQITHARYYNLMLFDYIGMCCDDQVDQYERRAYRKGVTAHEFATKATDFSLTTHKHLNWLYVSFSLVFFISGSKISENFHLVLAFAQPTIILVKRL